jgi:CHAT domain-containing protein/Tfp pilus assembly protein PilF
MALQIQPDLTSDSQLRQITLNNLIAIIFFTLLAQVITAYASLGSQRVAPSPQQLTETGSRSPQKNNDVQNLEPGKPLERALAGGESHFYQITLGAGQFLHVEVDQRGVDVLVTFFGPDGGKLAEVDSPNGRNGPEPVFYVAEASGVYRLEVRSPDKNAPEGRYEIKLEELRAATPQDKIRIAAERASADGLLLSAQGTAVAARKAIDKYEEARSLFRQAGHRFGEADALYSIGSLYLDLSEMQKALTYYEQALSLFRAEGNRPREATVLNDYGGIYYRLGQTEKGLEYLNRALAIREEVNDSRPLAATLSNLGGIYDALGEKRKALTYYERALPLFRATGDQSNEATVLGNIGSVNIYIGETQKALNALNQALTINQKSGNKFGNAFILNNIGRVYEKLGDSQEAINYYQQALSLTRASGDKYGEGNLPNNIGKSYDVLGERQKALDFLNKGLALRQAISDRRGEAITLNNLGLVYYSLGDKQKALDYLNQALAVHQKVVNRSGEASALAGIGKIYDSLGEKQKAISYYDQAIAHSRAVVDQAAEASALYEVSRIERDRDNLIEARSRIEASLAAVESLRAKVVSQQLRASFLASVRKYYEFNVGLLMQLHKQRPKEGFDAAALAASEKGRARSLLEMLAEARAEIREGADPALLERERSLQRVISDKAERQMRLLSGKYTVEQATAATKEIDALTAEYEQLQAQIREKSPRYAALTQPQPLSLQDIQKQVLDEETLLLEYALGEQSSFLWAVTPTWIKSFELPKGAEIESVARRIYGQLTARNKHLPQETLAQRQQRVELADAEYSSASATLSKMLLGPVAAELKNKRLLVVSEGILQYVPFAALPNPLAADSHPLIVDNEIVSLPSASVLAVLRQESAGRKLGNKAVAVLADPVFSDNDPRVAVSDKRRVPGSEGTSVVADAKRSATEAGLADLVRLRFSRQEADEITRLAADKMKLKAVDFAANRDLATGAGLGQYRIIHFATHGLINNDHPELSGVVLSLVDEQGRPQNGFLRLYDIYNLKLGADLVVLSACQTALGKAVRGEGIVGLTRGFMYAGAARVGASLWQIDDRVTAELMKRFYEAMLREGLRPAAALRTAEVSMWKEQRWKAPYYWAAFVLQGEWK